MGTGFDRSYEENKKKFWKEVRRVRKGGWRTEETVKDVNGRLLRGNEARKRWAEYFELLNVQEDREAVGGVQVPVIGEENEREITIEEVKRALNETKGGKAPGMDWCESGDVERRGCDCTGMVGECLMYALCCK